MGRLVGDLKERTLRFGVDVMQALLELPNETRGWIVGKQLGRAATSIGANVWEADAAISESDFASKVSIARKESHESEYWIELGMRLRLIGQQTAINLRKEASELSRILGAIVRKTQEHIHNAQ